MSRNASAKRRTSGESAKRGVIAFIEFCGMSPNAVDSKLVEGERRRLRIERERVNVVVGAGRHTTRAGHGHGHNHMSAP